VINPLDFIPKTALVAAVVVLTLTNLKAHWDSNNLTADVANGKARIAQLEGAIDKANAKSAEISESLTRKVLDAQVKAKQREATILADAAATSDALDSLRLSTSQARAAYRLSGPTATASYLDPTTGLDLLDICAKEYSDLAAKADGHVSDIQTVIAAWPVQ
jgi:hypothetical protein